MNTDMVGKAGGRISDVRIGYFGEDLLTGLDYVSKVVSRRKTARLFRITLVIMEIDGK